MKVLLADSLPDEAIARLRAAGDEVVVDADLTVEDLPAALNGIEVLVVRSTNVDAAAINSADRLGLIVRAGAGTNNIDCDRAAELGVFVCNVPGRNALAVAELTMGLLLAVDRHIANATADLRDGKWNKSGYGKSDGLHGRRLGIVGLGDIGIAVAQRATGFGMDVVAVEKSGRSEAILDRAVAAGVTFVDNLNTLLATSDAVSLHVPGRPETVGMVDHDFLVQMREGAILLNTSRGDVVDEAALIDAMNSRGLRAGLDVFADEPQTGTGEFASKLASHVNVVATHHIGASTAQAQTAVASGTIDAIESYRHGEIAGCVNMEIVPPRASTLTVRHEYRVGVLANILAVLRGAGINISNMQNQIFSGSKAAVATIDVGSKVPEEVLDEINALDHVIHAAVTRP